MFPGMVSPLLLVKEYLAPSAALPIRWDLTGILGRRPRALALLGAQTRVILSWGAEYRAALRQGQCSKSRTAVRFRDRDDAAQVHPTTHTCTN